MRNLEALTNQLEADRNPAAAIGRFLIASSNSPEFLAAHLEAFAAAAKADLAADREFAGRLLRSIGAHFDEAGTRNADAEHLRRR